MAAAFLNSRHVSSNLTMVRTIRPSGTSVSSHISANGVPCKNQVYMIKKMCESRNVDHFDQTTLSRDELKMMVKRYPHCTVYSAETAKKKLEFLVKKMNWPLEVVVMIPSVIGYSLEGLIGSENPPMSSVLVCTDQEFLNRYVMKHDNLVPKLMAIFTRDSVS